MITRPPRVLIKGDDSCGLVEKSRRWKGGVDGQWEVGGLWLVAGWDTADVSAVLQGKTFDK